MAQVVIGLFHVGRDAGHAISELSRVGFTKDISVISKDTKTGAVRLYQVKQSETEDRDESIGADIGAIAGFVGGLSSVLNPALASPAVVGALAVTMGVVGAALGEAAGGYIGDLHHADIPPARAKICKDKIRNGEVLVSVVTDSDSVDTVRGVMSQHKASDIQSIVSER